MMNSKIVPNVEYKNILYATDLSEAGRVAFPHAASIARKYDAELTVFHVLDTRDFEETIVGYISEDTWADIKHQDLEEARRLLVERKRDNAETVNSVDQFHKHYVHEHDDSQPYVSYNIEVREGDAVENILQETNTGKYDLLVLAKRGHGIFYGGLMGDTVRRVLRRCLIPALVVHMPEDDEQDET